jgi:hypothetical protein
MVLIIYRLKVITLLIGVYNCILPFCRRSELVVGPGGLCLVVGDAQNSEAVAPVVKVIKHFTIVIKHSTILIRILQLQSIILQL